MAMKAIFLFFISFYALTLFGEEIKVIDDPKNSIEWLDKEFNDNIWKMAKSMCSQEDYAGHHDWRLPTLKELKSLATDEEQKALFTHIYDGLYWASEEEDEFSAYAIYIGNGFKSSNDKCDKYLYLCVRNK